MSESSFPQHWTSRVLTGDGVLSGVDALHDTFSLFLVQCVIILSICRLLGLLGARFNQPKVIFEIIGGILLGPSAIGRNQTYLNTIFPPQSLPLLSVVANLGLVLYLFVVGMELDPKLLATHARKAGAIAFMGMAIPFALGIAICQIMFDTLQKNDPKYAKVSFISFFVFIGTAMSITAFPVLARILKESGLIYTTAGSMAMGAAALNDAAAWCLLVLAISLANSANLSTAGYVFACVVAFSVILIVAFRPLWWKLVVYVENMNSASMNSGLFCLTLILVFLCAWTTALLGLDAIFGAFLFGLIMPRDSHLFKECNEKIEELVLSLTLPLYFALSGLKTDVTEINTADQGAMVVLVCFIATIGKYIGAGSAAYFGGMSFRESSVIAALMNTRGLVELIVLNLGVNAGILSRKTFSVMVIMCLVTTFMTCPVVNCIYPAHLRIPANDSDYNAETDEELGLKEYKDDEETKSMQDDDEVAVVVQTTKLGVIVDRMEHLQGLMSLLSCFIPNNSNSKLSVTAIRAFEPSMTERDCFIGLDGSGRLINVEEESTSLFEARANPHNHNTKIVNPELLPLSMFLRAMGSGVKAYRMRGDPKEFPQAINALTGKSCSLILFPWRASQYVERLFWHSLRTVAAPVAVVVMCDTILSPTVADIAGGRTFNEKEHRVRSQSLLSEKSRAAHVTTDSEHGANHSASNHVENLSSPLGQISPPSHAALSPTPGNSGGGLLRLFSGYSLDHEELSPPPYTKGRRQNAAIKKVLAIVTGSSMCAALFPLVLNFAEKRACRITVLIGYDAKHFAEPLIRALAAFKLSVEALKHVTIKTLPESTNGLEAILTYCTSNMHDLIVFGHSVVDPTATRVEDGPVDVIPFQSQRTHRSSSVAFSLPAAVDAPELRRQSSAPEFYSNTHLAHPELGLLGNHLNERGLASFLMILHDSFCSKQRSNTLLEVPPAFDLVASRKEPLTLSLIEPASIQNLI